MKAAVMDPVILPKLHFFKFVSCVVEPFLRKFQSPLPLSPIIWEQLESLLRNLLMKFVKPKVLIEANTLSKLCSIDVYEDKNCMRKPDIGFGAKEALSSATPEALENFYKDCKQFLSKLTDALLRKFVLNSRCFRNASCLSPTLLRSKPELCSSRLAHFLEELLRLKRIEVKTADSAKAMHLLNDGSFKTHLENFNLTSDRLDTFFSSIIGKNTDYKELFSVIQKILILSHGNAQVESE